VIPTTGVATARRGAAASVKSTATSTAVETASSAPTVKATASTTAAVTTPAMLSERRAWRGNERDR
jgi:hypothetical protein